MKTFRRSFTAGFDLGREDRSAAVFVVNDPSGKSWVRGLWIGPPAHREDALAYVFASEPQTQGLPTMNSTATVMLFEENGVQPCKVEYDPEGVQNRGANHTHFFKCVDPSVKKDDLVIVTTHTRHGFTIAKVVDIGFADVPVDFDDTSISWGWVAAKFDRDGFVEILKSEKTMVGMVAEANANKMRDDIKNAMGLNKVSMADVFIKKPAALATPHGEQPEERPVPAPEKPPEA